MARRGFRDGFGGEIKAAAGEVLLLLAEGWGFGAHMVDVEDGVVVTAGGCEGHWETSSGIYKRRHIRREKSKIRLSGLHA